jgi:hypothetical protein
MGTKPDLENPIDGCVKSMSILALEEYSQVKDVIVSLHGGLRQQQEEPT